MGAGSLEAWIMYHVNTILVESVELADGSSASPTRFWWTACLNAAVEEIGRLTFGVSCARCVRVCLVRTTCTAQNSDGI